MNKIVSLLILLFTGLCMHAVEQSALVNLDFSSIKNNIVTDASGNNNEAVFKNGKSTVGANGLAALELSGNKSRLEIASPILNAKEFKNFTMAIRCSFDKFPVKGKEMWLSSRGNWNWRFYIGSDKRIAFWSNNDSRKVVSIVKKNLSAGEHLFAVTWNSKNGETILYVDGTAVGKADNKKRPVIPSKASLVIGHNPGHRHVLPFKGKILQFCLYDRVLSPEELKALPVPKQVKSISLNIKKKEEKQSQFFNGKYPRVKTPNISYKNYGTTPFADGTFFIGIVDWRLESESEICAYSAQLERLGFGKILPLSTRYFKSVSLKELEKLVTPAVASGAIVVVNALSPASVYKEAIQEDKILLLKKLAGKRLLLYAGEDDGQITRRKRPEFTTSPAGNYRKMADFYGKAYKFFENNKIPYFCGSESTYDDLLLSSNLPGLCTISYGNKMNTELKLSYIRGAAKMHDKKVGAYLQFWGCTPNWYPGRPFKYEGPGKIGNMGPLQPVTSKFTTCRRCGAKAADYLLKPYGDEADFFACANCGFTAGKPVEGYRVAQLLSLFSGARFLIGEELPEAYMAKSYLLPYGSVLQEIRKIYQKLNGKIGLPVIRTAVLVSTDNGWNAPYKYVPQKVWGGSLPISPAEKMFGLFDVFYPNATSIRPIVYNNVKVGEEGKLSSADWHDNDLIYPCDFTDTPFGQIDVVTTNVSPSQLASYQLLICLGPLNPDTTLKNKLVGYVKNGGSLAINIRQLGNDPAWIEKLSGAKINTEKLSSVKGKATFADGVVTLPERMELVNVIPGNAKTVAVVDDLPAAIYAASGRGSVTLSLVPYLLQKNGKVSAFGKKLISAMALAVDDGVKLDDPSGIEYVLTEDSSSYKLLVLYYGSKPWREAAQVSTPGKIHPAKLNSEKKEISLELKEKILGKLGAITELYNRKYTLSRSVDIAKLHFPLGAFDYRIFSIAKKGLK